MMLGQFDKKKYERSLRKTKERQTSRICTKAWSEFIKDM